MMVKRWVLRSTIVGALIVLLSIAVVVLHKPRFRADGFGSIRNGMTAEQVNECLGAAPGTYCSWFGGPGGRVREKQLTQKDTPLRTKLKIFLQRAKWQLSQMAGR